MAAEPDTLAEVACELVTRVRDDDPEDNGRWLAATLPNPDDRWALLFILAAAIPDDRPWSELIGWRQPQPPATTATGRALKPCGTTAAAVRHRYHGEPVCEACRQAERASDRLRKPRRVVTAKLGPGVVPGEPTVDSPVDEEVAA